MFDVGERTIFVTLAGSQAHGTAREGSDVDLRGVCIAPLELRLSLFQTFEQSEAPLTCALQDAGVARLQAHPTAAAGLRQRTETVIFELAKFVTLCAAGNPNALEILFADERDWLHETPTGPGVVHSIAVSSAIFVSPPASAMAIGSRTR
jgi:predicted nucleotidyltransferase